METFCLFSASCNPSQSTNAEEVKVVSAMLDKITGVPYGGRCTCTVGFSLTCGHIGVTLFRLCDLVASGIKEDSELACTDVLCEGASASATIFDELKISKKWTTLEGPQVTVARRSVIQIHSSMMLFLRWKRTYFKPHTTCVSIAQLLRFLIQQDFVETPHLPLHWFCHYQRKFKRTTPYLCKLQNCPLHQHHYQ